MAATPERNKYQIFIGNLSRRLKQEEVTTEFARFGKIKEVIMKSGFAFVVGGMDEGRPTKTRRKPRRRSRRWIARC